MNRRDVLGVLGAAGLAGAGELAEAADHRPAHAEGAPLYLCAFHIAKKDPSFVIEAHHYCSPVNDEIHQCVIYDAAGKNARILGVEYIISDALYKKLTDAENGDWGAVGVWGLLLLGIAFLALFVWVESRAKEPMIPLHLFRIRSFAIRLSSERALTGEMGISEIPSCSESAKASSAVRP